MTSPQPRQTLLEEMWQWRVNEARQDFEKQPTDGTREELLRALRILGAVSRGTLPTDTDH